MSDRSGGLNPGKIEVELKAWVDEPEKVRRRVARLARFERELREHDLYFTFADTRGYQVQRFRLRTIRGKNMVTVKIPSGSRKGVEANREFEFEISDPAAFKVFCREFGFRVLIEKHKQVRRYYYRPPKKLFARPVTIDLNQVRHLGNFIEIETLVDSQNQIPKASKFLQSLLDILGVPRSKIEPTAYTELLYAKIHH